MILALLTVAVESDQASPKTLSQWKKKVLQGFKPEILVERFSPATLRVLPDATDEFVDDLHMIGSDSDDRLQFWEGMTDFDNILEPSLGFSRLGSLANPLLHALAAGNAHGKLHEDDQKVWDRVGHLMPSTKLCKMIDDPCKCVFVGCVRAEGGNSLHISALVLGSMTSEPDQGAILDSIKNLYELRALHVVDVRSYDGTNLPTIPQLLSLSVYGHGVRMLSWASEHTQLVSLNVAQGAHVHDMADLANELSNLCKLQNLRMLRLPNTQTPIKVEMVPSCWSKELTILDLRGNDLKHPPVQLELPELRTFVAFGQGLTYRHPGGCMPFFETLLDEDVVWKCPVMKCSLDAFLELKWPRLEKLWLDANYISGQIPEAFLDHFPALISLDLHDNNLSGPIPANFAARAFRKLQLHSNLLSGPVPQGLWHSKHLDHFSVFMNSGLTGCPQSLSCDNSGSSVWTWIASFPARRFLFVLTNKNYDYCKLVVRPETCF